MTAKHPRPLLPIYFEIWGVVGKNIWFTNRGGKRLVIQRLQDGRDYANKNGYAGIRVIPK